MNSYSFSSKYPDLFSDFYSDSYFNWISNPWEGSHGQILSDLMSEQTMLDLYLRRTVIAANTLFYKQELEKWRSLQNGWIISQIFRCCFSSSLSMKTNFECNSNVDIWTWICRDGYWLIIGKLIIGQISVQTCKKIQV